ncbi:retinal short-chain dehydrogenase reductase [Suillus bovinus]|uniref:retinal short-chain dehydrogenase reductase n=1 Tax=Suillus bovinus TaxID=48563 RepID=UPI001B87B274|nr:retinal short-chain dehydrogenase reductase [Suillus bovinus]KAG2155034.1 retinal short-chain dehydrogenase reductase [Suillus bovinus]
MNAPGSSYEPAPIYDSVDIDMVVKVLSQTAFSPFFTCFIPIFYVFQGYEFTNPVVLVPCLYCAAVSAFWLLKWISQLYRNQGSFFFKPEPLDWSEQIVVITGGASGVGELLANTLAVRNVTVVVLDINPIVTENHNVVYYPCDISKWEEVEAVSKRIIDEVGQPTMLVNNAGVVQGKLIVDLTPNDVYQTFGVNTLAHFWTLKAFLPGMIKNKTGHIVTMSSIMGFVGCVRMADYSASKAALVTMNESLRYELDNVYNAPGIRTTIVCPAHILTPLFSTVQLPSNRFFQFFAPSVAPVTVVKEIITALDAQQSRTIYLPFYANLSPALRMIPSYLRDLCQKLSGADHSMRNFTKVTARRPDEEDLSVANGKE